MPLNLVVNNSSSCCFDPDAIERLTAAYEGACAELHVPSNGPSLKEIVAKKIIEHAQRGERDPLLLQDVVVAELRLEANSGS